MPQTKNQLDAPVAQAQFNAMVLSHTRDLQSTHAAVSVMMNTSAEAAQASPNGRGSPFAIEPGTHQLRSASAIHAQGLKVHLRLTDCHTEGLYGFTKWVGPSRVQHQHDGCPGSEVGLALRTGDQERLDVCLGEDGDRLRVRLQLLQLDLSRQVARLVKLKRRTSSWPACRCCGRQGTGPSVVSERPRPANGLS